MDEISVATSTTHVDRVDIGTSGEHETALEGPTKHDFMGGFQFYI